MALLWRTNERTRPRSCLNFTNSLSLHCLPFAFPFHLLQLSCLFIYLFFIDIYFTVAPLIISELLFFYYSLCMYFIYQYRLTPRWYNPVWNQFPQPLLWWNTCWLAQCLLPLYQSTNKTSLLFSLSLSLYLPGYMMYKCVLFYTSYM